MLNVNHVNCFSLVGIHISYLSTVSPRGGKTGVGRNMAGAKQDLSVSDMFLNVLALFKDCRRRIGLCAAELQRTAEMHILFKGHDVGPS